MLEINLSDAEVLRDPFAAYGRAREEGAVARLVTPGFGDWCGLPLALTAPRSKCVATVC